MAHPALPVLRFNVQGIRGTITKATLRLYAQTASSVGSTVQRVTDNTWNETTINYKNAPKAGKIINLTGTFGANSWIEVDLTSHVTGTGLVSVALFPHSSASIRFTSHKSETNAPQLVVETNAASGTPTRTTTLPPATRPRIQLQLQPRPLAVPLS